jgi:DNA polymerase-3 subunit beta
MKIVCQKDVLSKAVSLAQSAVSNKSTLPILGNLLFEVSKDGVDILGTDLEIGLKVRVEAEIVNPGFVTIPAKKLSEIIRECPDGEIEISSDANHRVLIQSGKTSFKIVGLAKDEYPNLPILKEDKGINIPSIALLEMIHKAAISVSNDDTRHILNGALFQIEGNEARMISTDSHRLTYVKRVLEEKHAKHQAIVPHKAMAELQKILDSSSDPVKVNFSDNQIFFEKGSVMLVSRVIDGTYPNYDQVIPKKNDQIMTTDTDSLLKAVRRVGILASEKSSPVKMTLKGPSLTIQSNTPDLGEAEEELEVAYSGNDMTVAYNARYLQDCLKVMGSAKVEVRLSSPLNPALLVPEGGDGSYLYVVMPMRL